MGIGRFLNKQIHKMDGFRTGNDDAGMYMDGDTAYITRPLNVEGVVTASGLSVGSLNVLGGITATAVTFNTAVVGSATITRLLAGSVTGTAVGINTLTVGSATITNALLGAMTGTAVGINTLTVGSATITNALLGAATGTAAVVDTLAFKASSAAAAPGAGILTNVWRTTYTWNMGAIAAMNVGSINSIINVDAAMSGAAVGDLVMAAPVGSVDVLVGWQATVQSANVVNIRAWYTGSITLTPGNVPFKLVVMKI